MYAVTWPQNGIVSRSTITSNSYSRQRHSSFHADSLDAGAGGKLDAEDDDDGGGHDNSNGAEHQDAFSPPTPTPIYYILLLTPLHHCCCSPYSLPTELLASAPFSFSFLGSMERATRAYL